MRRALLLLALLTAGCVGNAPISWQALEPASHLGSMWHVRYDIDFGTAQGYLELRACGVETVQDLGGVVVVEVEGTDWIVDSTTHLYVAGLPIASSIAEPGQTPRIDMLNAEANTLDTVLFPFLPHLSQHEFWQRLLPPVLAEHHAMQVGGIGANGTWKYGDAHVPFDLVYEFDGKILPARIHVDGLSVEGWTSSEWELTRYNVAENPSHDLDPAPFLARLPGTSAVPYPQITWLLGPDLDDAMRVAAGDWRVSGFMDRGEWWIRHASTVDHDSWEIGLASLGSTTDAEFVVGGQPPSVREYFEVEGSQDPIPLGLEVPDPGVVSPPWLPECPDLVRHGLLSYKAVSGSAEATIQSQWMPGKCPLRGYDGMAVGGSGLVAALFYNP